MGWAEMAPFLTLLLKYGTSGFPQQGKRAQGCVLPVCMSSHQSCAPLGTHLCQSCLDAAHPQIIFPFPCAFSHHQKGCELILASCPAHWDNYGFGVNIYTCLWSGLGPPCWVWMQNFREKLCGETRQGQNQPQHSSTSYNKDQSV